MKAVNLPLSCPLVNLHQVSQMAGLFFIPLPAELEFSSHTLPAKYIHEPLQHYLKIFCQNDMANFNGYVSRWSLSFIFVFRACFVMMVKMACLLFSCLHWNNTSFCCLGIHKKGSLERVCVTSVGSLSKLSKFFLLSLLRQSGKPSLITVTSNLINN